MNDGKYTEDQMRAIEAQRTVAEKRSPLPADQARENVMARAKARHGK